MKNKANVAILGAGQIGQAVFDMMIKFDDYDDPDWYNTPFVSCIIIDSNPEILSSYIESLTKNIDFNEITVSKLASALKKEKITHVINALPFYLNEKVATASKLAKCHYIDFTEDDVMADKVQEIYKDSDLTCAVKCGLAPGFINYLGHNLVNQIKNPNELVLSVGALPRNVSYDLHGSDCRGNYNITWSVDGLVNEYLRPCKVRRHNMTTEINPLSEINTVIIDGTTYEASPTSGGIGSLVNELTNVPDVTYMTLRYPGHYSYVNEVITNLGFNFDKIKERFKQVFPICTDDVIVVYANALGYDDKGNYIRKSYAEKFYGVNGLTGIQSTTAGSGVAVLELMLNGKISGIVNHKDISFDDFIQTKSFKKYYKSK